MAVPPDAALGTEVFGDLRISRAEALARQLEHDIIEGALPAGQRLGTKNELRTRFGVAVATMNEALRMLEMRGLIEARPGPGGGVFTCAPSGRVRLANYILSFRNNGNSTTAADCLIVRNALEPLVCREASRSARLSDIRDLEKILKRMEAEADNSREYLRWNWALHRRIAGMCKNAPLHILYVTLLDFVEEDLDNVTPEHFDSQQNIEVHRALVAAIASHDEDQVEAALEVHNPPAGRER